MKSTVQPIVKKELKTYFNSPIAYIVFVVFLTAASVWFFLFNGFFAGNYASLRGYFSSFPFLFIIVIPAMTMRLWAEERKMKSDEILLTLPFTETQLVLGKFFGAFVLFLIMIALTLAVPFLTAFTGSFEPGEMIGQYLGTALFGALCIAVGMFFSSLCSNQISAFLVSVLALAFLVLSGYFPMMVEMPNALARIINTLFATHHFDSFKKGLFDSRDFIYFVGMTVLFLYLNIRILILKKWK
ncbi:MAG: ABC transporter permease [Spirochaetia bacterium]|nr:ABC transporter permease [Spirochaetia bacterium]